MLACGLDVRITFDIPLTILSAAVAVVFTFAAFSTTDQPLPVSENTAIASTLSTWGSTLRDAYHAMRRRGVRDEEAAHHTTHCSGEEQRPILASTSDRGDEDDEDDEVNRDEHNPGMQRSSIDPSGSQHRSSTDSAGYGFYFSPPLTHPARGVASLKETSRSNAHSSRHGKSSSGRHGSSAESARAEASSSSDHHAIKSPPLVQSDVQEGPPSTRTSEESTPLTTDSSDDSLFSASRPSTSSHNRSISTTLSTLSWSEPLHAGLSREARLRIKAQARDKPVPQFGWRYWLKAYYSSISLFVILRAAIWGMAIVFMHYCGQSSILRVDPILNVYE